MSSNSPTLQTVDYVVFAAMLAMSIAIGVFYAFRDRKRMSTSEYLVGGRQMAFAPVAISLVVSFQSSIMILGSPAESYLYGMQFVVGTVGTMIVIMLSTRYMVPLFKPLNLTTAYEYLELRYRSRAVYLLGSLLGMITNIWYMGIVLFGPAVALEAVTGFPQLQSVFIIAAVSVLYTAIGGIKAVVWTDVFQACIMLVGVVAVSVKATVDTGGIREVWSRAYNSGRINFFNFDTDLRVRHTFWNLVLSDMTSGLSAVYSQQTIQRVNSTKSLKDAKRIMFLLGPAFVLCVLMASSEGVVAQSYYSHKGCDPLKAGYISNPNQLVPYLVMEMFHQVPGMPGLFIATLFSASLSTLSSCLSSLSSQVWSDFVRPAFPGTKDSTATAIAKLSVVVFGLLGCGVAMMIARMSGPLTQILGSLVHAASAPASGLFVLGCFFPWANAKGAIVGGLTSMAVVTWIGIGTSFSDVVKESPWLPLGSTDMCPIENSTLGFNTTSVPSSLLQQTTEILTTTQAEVQGVELLYTVSYKWIPILGLIIVIVIGLLVSFITGGNKSHPVPHMYLVSLPHALCCCLPTCRNKQYDLAKRHDVTSHDGETKEQLKLAQTLIVKT